MMPSDLNEEEKKIFRNTLANKKILIYDDIYLYLLDELLIHPRLFVYFEKLNFNAISQNQKYEIKEDQNINDQFEKFEKFEQKILEQLKTYKEDLLQECKFMIKSGSVKESDIQYSKEYQQNFKLKLEQQSKFKNGKLLKVPLKYSQLRFFNNLKVYQPPIIYQFKKSTLAKRRRDITTSQMDQIFQEVSDEKFGMEQISKMMKLSDGFKLQFDTELENQGEKSYTNETAQLFQKLRVNERELKEYIYQAIFMKYGQNIEDVKPGWKQNKVKSIKEMSNYQQVISTSAINKQMRNQPYAWFDYVCLILKFTKVALFEPDILNKKSDDILTNLRVCSNKITALIVMTESTSMLHKINKFELLDLS